MSYPSSYLGYTDFQDKGTSKTQLNVTIQAGSPYASVDLDYVPLSKTTGTNGEEIPSTISVQTTSGKIYTEVYSISELTGRTFFTDTANKKLYFASDQAGIVVNVSYKTRGDVIYASYVNDVNNDLARMQRMFQYGVVTLDGTGNYTLDLSTVWNEFSLTDIVVLATSQAGNSVSFTINISAKTVTFTGTASDLVHYLVIPIF